jgi:antitoxin component YwqK of YwqJK toxin-antitoxin module
MKIGFLVLVGAMAVTLFGCRKNNQDDNVVSQRYIHKYGYAVSKEEWEAKNYPGQVITNMSNGVVITATYENGVLQGPMTQTFPHSQTVQFYDLYNQGCKVKEISYDPAGMPLQERIQLSPTRYTLTQWYIEGTPRCIEDFAGQELLEGQYYTVSNEIEARVEKGSGRRVLRDGKGALLAKEEVAGGYVTKRETFYPNGAPESISYLNRGQLDGEKRTFSLTGEPLAIEEWVDGKLHGKSTYFKNGTKYLEISYLNGEKNGREIHFIDGDQISQELCWENNQKHGPAVFYIDGSPQKSWYYAGEQVSQRRFDELYHLDQVIGNLLPDPDIQNDNTQ